ncbi:MAG: hypothetical protein KDC87_15080, partial [Planctomycetes bacterium]|nr:hypothetical protein [Planctomycetota bacterium]
ILLLVVSTLLLGGTLAAQRANPKGTFQNLVKSAKNDPDQLLDAARYAREHKLEKEASALLKKLVKQFPDHAGINEAAGRVKHEGKWMDAKAAEKLVSAELREKYKAKGLVEVRGIWVEKDQVEKAKKGIFFHEGEQVTRWEKRQFLQGSVRHPVTGGLIKAEDLQKAKDGMFPLGDGKWGDKEAADKLHASMRRPWIVRSNYCTVLANLPIDTLTSKVLPQIDQAYTRLLPVLGGQAPHPARRPLVHVVAKSGEYQDLGQRFGGGGSTYGAFHMGVQFNGVRGREGVALWAEGWGPFYVRHATGLALCYSVLADEWDDVPEWFYRAVGSYVDKHASSAEMQHFGKSHRKRGGVKDLAKWLKGYEISSELPGDGVGCLDYNIFQAGLLLSFCMRGGDADATKGLQAVTDALRDGKKAVPAILALQKILSGKEEQLRAYFEKLMK